MPPDFTVVAKWVASDTVRYVYSYTVDDSFMTVGGPGGMLRRDHFESKLASNTLHKGCHVICLDLLLYTWTAW